MKRNFKFVVLIFKDEKFHMKFVFNTVEPMYFSSAYNLMVAKLRRDYSICLGYKFNIESVSSTPCIDSDLQ